MFRAGVIAVVLTGCWSGLGEVVARGESKWPDEAALRAKVSRYIVQSDLETGLPPPEDRQVNLDLVDLNGDGTPEALLVIEGSSDCGAMGCSAYVLDLSGTEARSIGGQGGYTTRELKALKSKTGGWRDILIGGRRRVKFRDGKYGRKAKNYEIR